MASRLIICHSFFYSEESWPEKLAIKSRHWRCLSTLLVEEYLLTGYRLVPFSNCHKSSQGKPLYWSANVLKISVRSCWRDAYNYGKIAAKNAVLYSCWKGFPAADNWPKKIIAATKLSLYAKSKIMDTVNTQFVVFFTRITIGIFSYVNLIK